MAETIKIALNENPNITPEGKENLMELIEIFNKKFPDVDLNDFSERLKTLIIRRESMFLVKLPCQYNPHNNEILINLGRFEECDARHWMMHALLGVITAKNNYYGFNNEEDNLVALNEGYTEIITDYLVGADENSFYFDEAIGANILGEILGNDTLYEAYFSNDAKKLLGPITQESTLNSINNLFNAYYKMNIQVGNEKQTCLKQVQSLMGEKWSELSDKWIPAYAEECTDEKCYKEEFPAYTNVEQKEISVSTEPVTEEEIETLDISPVQKRL